MTATSFYQLDTKLKWLPPALIIASWMVAVPPIRYSLGPSFIQGYRSIQDILDRMRDAHQSYLVLGPDAPESVLGLAAFWPLSQDEMRARFSFISSHGGFEIWKLASTNSGER